jgi:Ca2+-binding RTX toxin-like protein
MIGGNGDDTYFVDNSFDVVIEAGDSEGPPSEIRTGQAESSVGGNDAVWSTATYTLAPNVEILVLNGTADIDGTGNDLDNTIIGNSGNNRIDGAVGSDIMIGGAGNDTYFVDDLHDQVVEFAGEGIDTVNSTVGAGLTANVENLNLIGFGNINGVGNAGANTIVGNDGDNGIDGAGGADTLTGGLGNDTFIFGPGQANGDTVTDFSGNGAGTADRLMFSGYGPGATFTNIDPTHWQVNYNGATQHDIITFSNGAIIDPHDVFFV